MKSRIILAIFLIHAILLIQQIHLWSDNLVTILERFAKIWLMADELQQVIWGGVTTNWFRPNVVQNLK